MTIFSPAVPAGVGNITEWRWNACACALLNSAGGRCTPCGILDGLAADSRGRDLCLGLIKRVSLLVVMLVYLTNRDPTTTSSEKKSL